MVDYANKGQTNVYKVGGLSTKAPNLTLKVLYGFMNGYTLSHFCTETGTSKLLFECPICFALGHVL